jgi:hypothetical protein
MGGVPIPSTFAVSAVDAALDELTWYTRALSQHTRHATV